MGPLHQCPAQSNEAGLISAPARSQLRALRPESEIVRKSVCYKGSGLLDGAFPEG